VSSLSTGKYSKESGRSLVQESKQRGQSQANLLQSVFPGTSEMARIMRELDWSKTPLGSVVSWSPALRMMGRFLLSNRFPLLLWWGPQFCQLYNDAYRPILGKKHPQFVGRPVSECWSEIWHILEPLIQTPFEGGPSTWIEDFPLEVNRHGFLEETHFTVAYSPVPDETVPSGIGGVLATVHEITEKVIGERRTMALRDLGASILEERSAEEACARAADVLAQCPKDIIFALLYLLDPAENVARLAGSAGLEENSQSIAPTVIELSDKNAIWPISNVISTDRLEVVEGLGRRFTSIPCGEWSDPAHSAAVVPIRSNVAHQLAGFLIVGISPRLRFDELYQSFVELAASQIATAVANARAYEEERKRAEVLAELDRAKTVFFSNVSHEFRTPLTLMLGPLEDVLGKASARLDSEEQRQLEVTRRNALRLLKLVNTLLDFSRIEAGRVHAVYEPTNLASLTGDIASVFRSAMEKAGLQFSVKCEPIDEPVYVDRDMWEKIVLNLLSNAFKFTFEGEVALTLKSANDSVELSVRDTGVGISPEEQGRVFERFHRVESTRARTYEGTGIGLALVQELVKLHSGTVRLESTPGLGSTFTVLIPRGKAHLPVDRIGAERTLASTAVSADAYVDEAVRWLPNQSGAIPDEAAKSAMDVPGATRNSTPNEGGDLILVADDNADMRDYVVHLLRGEYNVHAVADGTEAVKAAYQLRPSLVLTDVMMPKLDGFGVLQAIRSNELLKNTPVILLSARAGEESKIEGLHAGADDYLVKPFTAGELIARVTTHVNMAKLRRQAAEREARLRAEAELERNRLQELLSQAPAAIGLMTGPEHRWVFVNDHYVRVTGRNSAADFVGKTVRESLPEIETQPFLPLLDEVHRTGQPYFGKEMKAVLNRGSGGQPEDAYFDFVYQPLRNADGNVDGILVHAVDVTDKVLSRKSTEENAERLRVAYSAGQIGAWEWDPVKNTRSLSDELHRMFGIDKSDSDSAQTWASRVHPDDLQGVLENMAEAHRVGEMDFEYRYYPREGELRWFHCKGRRFSGETRLFGIVQDVTERKHATEAHRRLAAIVESSDDAIVSKDLNSIVKSWNRQAEHLFGYKKEEMIGRSILTIIPPELHSDEEMILSKIKSGEKIDHFETVRVAKSGERIDVSLSISPVRDEHGKIVGAAKIARDIRQRKRAEQALRVQEERIKSDLEAMRLLHEVGVECARAGNEFTGCLQQIVKVAIAVTGADKGNLQIREPGSGVLRIAAHQGFDQPFLDFFATVREGEDACCGWALRQGGRIVVEDATQSEIFMGQESLNVLRAENVRAVQSTPLVSTSGSVLGMISTHFAHPHRPSEREFRLIDLLARQAADYIERKQAEESLRLRTEQFQALLDNAPLGVYLVDSEFRIRQVNPIARPTFGHIPDLVGRDFDEVMHILWNKHYADEVVRIFRHTLDTGEPYETRESIEHRIDRNVTEYYEWRVDRIPLPEGGYGVVCYFRDISAQVKARIALAQQEERLRKTEKMAAAGHLAASLAHEINNPLSSVTNALFLLNGDPALHEEARSLASLASTELARVSRIVKQSLSYYRVGIVPKEFDLATVVQESLQIFAEKFQREGVQVIKKITPGSRVMGFADEVRQVIDNLLLNALEATPAGGQLRISLHPSSNWVNQQQGVRLTIADTGSGIPKEHLSKIFEPFFTTKPEKGTGLGLWVVRGIVAKHDGNIRVRSSQGIGTVISILWPAAKREHPATFSQSGSAA
jgi:PAS domain S-box-containing protein